MVMPGMMEFIGKIPEAAKWIQPIQEEGEK